MGNAETFSLPPVKRLLDRWLTEGQVIVDPFARNSTRGTVTNDLNPATTAQYHMLAEDFVEQVIVSADVVLFDPPYSPRQISECYQQIGRKCGTQNSMGFGLTRGYELKEILLVTHGAAHNDTIVTVERKNVGTV